VLGHEVAAVVVAQRQAAGRPLEVRDVQIAGIALASEPAISTGMSVTRPAESAPSPTVMVLSSGFCRKRRPMSKSSQIWMNCSTVTVTMAGTANGTAILAKTRP